MAGEREKEKRQGKIERNGTEWRKREKLEKEGKRERQI